MDGAGRSLQALLEPFHVVVALLVLLIQTGVVPLRCWADGSMGPGLVPSQLVFGFGVCPFDGNWSRLADVG